MRVEEIYNYLQIDERFSSAGMPLAGQLRDAANQGFRAVVNLATYNPGHSLEDEAGLADELGLAYFHIPVIWDAPQPEDFETFCQVMNTQLPAEGRVLVHCAANFRATVFFGLYAQKHLGWNAEQARDLRAKIWQGSNYPIWEDFIKRMKADYDLA